MRFTDNAELTAENMTNTDILAGTDVSEQTDKKFSLAGLADWFLNRFTGLSLAGKNQSVKAALDELNSTFDSGTWVPSMPRNTLSDVNARWYRVGNILVVTARFTITASASGNSYITGASFPVPSGYNRVATTLNGTWHNANDAAGEIGQHNYGGNSAWFSKSGAHLQLPASTYAFTLVGILTKS